jgi:hypothetical protein
MKKPGFFIVGAARSGTTSLWQYLKTHPEVYMPEDELLKEPSFFSDDCGKKLGLTGYLSIFEQAHKNHKWIGEASVAYLTDPESARRIYDFNPEAKIIIMLRNPAQRAYSLYNWMVQDGYEYASTFEEGLTLEETRVHRKESNWYKPNYYWGYLYFRSGLYHDQAKRYLELFKEDVLIIKFEDFSINTASTYREVCSFLQIDPQHAPYQIHNPSHAVRSARILFILRKLNNYILQENQRGTPVSKISEKLKHKHTEIVNQLARVTRLNMVERISGKRILKKIENYLNAFSDEYPYRDIQSKTRRDQLLNLGLKPGKPPKLKKKTQNHLLNRFEPDIKKLSTLSGMDFSGWLE